ncbi:hypothetical protein KJ695_04715, partial [Patescibacteria group bacterium]|nr:hypothetical protein [Patescibacteria group bacterium]
SVEIVYFVIASPVSRRAKQSLFLFVTNEIAASPCWSPRNDRTSFDTISTRTNLLSCLIA